MGNEEINQSLQLSKTNSDLVPQESQRAHRQLELVGRIVTQLMLSDERRRRVELLLQIKHEDAIAAISSSSPISLELLDKYKDHWNWGLISRNKNIPWSLELIERFQDKWDWQFLSRNGGLL